MFPAKRQLALIAGKYSAELLAINLRRFTKGRAVIVCRLAPFLAVLALKHNQFGYCIGLASLLL
jgi:hypothetical protein